MKKWSWIRFIRVRTEPELPPVPGLAPLRDITDELEEIRMAKTCGDCFWRVNNQCRHRQRRDLLLMSRCAANLFVQQMPNPGVFIHLN